MSFFQDHLKPFFKKRDVNLIESEEEAKGIHTFSFEKENDLTWKAGQYGLFTIIHKKIKNPTRPFSVASAPNENVIKITTVIGNEPSEFKKALLELKPGMKINMRGPVGSFYITDNYRPTLMIAGGIGITPFRSIVKQLEATGNMDKENFHLIYMDSKKTFIFKDELDAAAQNCSINVSYVDSKDAFHQKVDQFTTTYKNEGQYLIAGPKSMVDSIYDVLQKSHVSKQNIKKDVLVGY